VNTDSATIVATIRNAPAEWSKLVEFSARIGRDKFPNVAAEIDAALIAYRARTADEVAAIRREQDEALAAFIADCRRQARLACRRRIVADRVRRRRPLSVWPRARTRTARAAPVRRRGSRRCRIDTDDGADATDDRICLVLAAIAAIENALRASPASGYLLRLLDDAEEHLLAVLERRIAERRR